MVRTSPISVPVAPKAVACQTEPSSSTRRAFLLGKGLADAAARTTRLRALPPLTDAALRAKPRHAVLPLARGAKGVIT